MNYIIVTERLGLRKWEDADFLPFAAMNKDVDVMKYFPSLLTDDETAAMINRINTHFDKHGFGLFALEKLSTKEFIGFTGFMVPSFKSFFTPCVEIGWRLRKQDWKNGYATEAAKACLEYGFTTLQFAKVYSFTSVINVQSEKVMQNTGMIKDGEFNHPNIPLSNALCRHIVYKIEKEH
jgi:[ribosomal protein S5]-alanine N-acetyltransferase